MASPRPTCQHSWSTFAVLRNAKVSMRARLRLRPINHSRGVMHASYEAAVSLDDGEVRGDAAVVRRCVRFLGGVSRWEALRDRQASDSGARIRCGVAVAL